MSEVRNPEKRTLIREMLISLSLSVQEEQIDQLLRYYEMLIDRNRVMNLTAITTFDDVVEKHFADSLLITKVLDLNSVSSVIDVGSGAGFPGMVMKILFPHLRMTMLDSLQKRVAFLNEVTENLGLDEVSSVHGRAEDYGRDEAFREQYDLCVSRAVADLSVLSELCIPFVKQSGMFISYKSAQAVEEVNRAGHAIELLGGSVCGMHRACLPFSGQERLFVCIEKKEPTPLKYPRRAGMPSKKPL